MVGKISYEIFVHRVTGKDERQSFLFFLTLACNQEIQVCIFQVETLAEMKIG